MPTHHRKRLHRYEIENQPRFLTFSCAHRLPLFSNDAIKRAFLEQINKARKATHFKLLAWVIMPEHVHLVIVPKLTEYPVAEVESALKSQFARSVIRRWKALRAPVLSRLRTNDGTFHFWLAGGGYDRNLRDEGELWEKINYVHANPATRGLVASPTDYPWSSARWYAGFHGDALLEIDAL
jgi:putative transposase